MINVSFKSMKKSSFNQAFGVYKNIIKKEFLRHKEYILGNANLDVESKERYENIINLTASDLDYSLALQFLSECMEKAYRKKVIILIDEYDVPLEAAYTKDFYNQMVDLVRDIFESALKTNDALYTGILTGCLRISKESIFTGFNNLDIFSILNPYFTDSFGFTQSEIDTMLEYYGLSDRAKEMKEWYDGYMFWKTEIYNPWSVINYVKNMIKDPDYGCCAY